MKEEDNSRLVEVFSGSRWEAELIKGLLERRPHHNDSSLYQPYRICNGDRGLL